HQRAVELAVGDERGSERHRRRPVGPDPYGVRGFPFALAHVEMIVARRAPPVDVLRRLARHEAAVLPEILAGSGAASSMQAVNDGRCDAARFENEPRHGSGERASAAGRLANRAGLNIAEPRLRHVYPMRAFSRLITFGIVSPSARAAKVSAMRCLSTGSASSSTSSTDGAKRPSSSARARTASIKAWLARGPGPQEISLPRSPASGPGRAERTNVRIASTTDSPTGKRRTSRCAAIKSSDVIAALARVSSAPVVS